MIRRWFESSPPAEVKQEAAAKEEKKVMVEAPPPPPAPAPLPAPSRRFGIAKVVEMVNNPHLSGLSPDAKRCALMMALEAVGVGVEELLQDAVLRQRALANEEEERQTTLRRFEETKSGINAKLQAELAEITNDFMTRMQSNVDDVAREQDKFRAWQRKKQQETQQIAEAAAVCVPEGSGTHGGSLTAVLERACAAHR
jgi:hypothetical protein